MAASPTTLRAAARPLHARLAAFACAVLFAACVLIARPFANMGIADDWSYLKTVNLLAQTGHIVYNGWASPIIGWQLYPAAWAVRLGGSPYTAPRLVVLLIAATTLYLTHRIFVRAGVSQRNATLGVLAIGLQPLYMTISFIFMTDISGLFALVLCLYCCVRAVQAGSPNAQTAWIVFGTLSNAGFGACRQTGWLGMLIFVPSALWLLRRNRRLVAIGVACIAAGVLFMRWCLHWFARQPYSTTEHFGFDFHGLTTVINIVRQLSEGLLDMPYLLLPLTVAFIPQLRRTSTRFRLGAGLFIVLYLTAAVLLVVTHKTSTLLEPVLGDLTSPYARFDIDLMDKGQAVLTPPIRFVLTSITLLGSFGILAMLLNLRKDRRRSEDTGALTWHQLAVLTVPFTLVYLAMLIPRSAGNLFDRYMLEFLVIAVLFLLRAYQQFIRPELPWFTTAAVAAVALYSIGDIHDMFSLDRARVEQAQMLNAAGIPDTHLNGGFDFDYATELRYSPTIHDIRVNLPPGFVQPYVDPLLGGESCDGRARPHAMLPHFEPHFGASLSPNACAGPAPFPATPWHRWLGRDQFLYVVRFQRIYRPWFFPS